jgi:hypothetical protein
MLEVELALAKPVGVFKNFHLLDVVVASSHGLRAMGVAVTHAAQVPAFDNIGDASSPDVRKTPSPERMRRNAHLRRLQ